MITRKFAFEIYWPLVSKLKKRIVITMWVRENKSFRDLSKEFFPPRYVLHVCHIFGEEITTYVSLLNFRRGFLRIRKKNGEIWSELKEEVWRNKAKGERRKEIVIILWRDRALSVAKVESQNSIVAVRTLQIRNLCNIYCQNFE